MPKLIGKKKLSTLLKCHIPESTLATIDAEAKRRGMARAELLRKIFTAHAQSLSFDAFEDRSSAKVMTEKKLLLFLKKEKPGHNWRTILSRRREHSRHPGKWMSAECCEFSYKGRFGLTGEHEWLVIASPESKESDPDLALLDDGSALLPNLTDHPL
jgi:hypothetical protein